MSLNQIPTLYTHRQARIARIAKQPTLLDLPRFSRIVCTNLVCLAANSHHDCTPRIISSHFGYRFSCSLPRIASRWTFCAESTNSGPLSAYLSFPPCTAHIQYHGSLRRISESATASLPAPLRQTRRQRRHSPFLSARRICRTRRTGGGVR